METARGHPRVGRAGIPRPAAGDQCSLPVDNGLQPQARRPGRCYPRTEDRDPVQRRKDVLKNGHSVESWKKRTVDRADSVPKGLRNANPDANNDVYAGKLL